MEYRQIMQCAVQLMRTGLLLSFVFPPPIKMLVELVFIICVIFFVTYGVLCKRFNSKINYWKNKNVAQHKDIKVKFHKVKELGG